jgi:hypothetical protein
LPGNTHQGAWGCLLRFGIRKSLLEKLVGGSVHYLSPRAQQPINTATDRAPNIQATGKTLP